MAEKGLATTLKIGTDLVGKLTSINGVEVSTDSIETTTLADTTKTYMPGLDDAGDISIEGNYEKNDVGQVALATARKNKTVDSYTITYPNGATMVFNGFPTKLKVIGDANMSDALKFSCTIKVSGEPTFTETV